MITMKMKYMVRIFDIESTKQIIYMESNNGSHLFKTNLSHCQLDLLTFNRKSIVNFPCKLLKNKALFANLFEYMIVCDSHDIIL